MDVKEEDLEKIKELEEKKQEVQQEVTAMVSQAKAKHGEEELEIERDGEMVTVTQNDLWEEISDPHATMSGREQAKDKLKEEHPGLFEKMEKENEIAETLAKKFQQTFGFSFKRMTPGRYVKMTEALVEYFTD